MHALYHKQTHLRRGAFNDTVHRPDVGLTVKITVSLNSINRRCYTFVFNYTTVCILGGLAATFYARIPINIEQV